MFAAFVIADGVFVCLLFFLFIICFCCAPNCTVNTVHLYCSHVHTVSLFKISLFAGIHANVYVYQCLFLCRAGVGVWVVGWLWLIPPAEVHTKLCSVDLPQCSCCCCPCCCLAACSPRIFFSFSLSAATMINTSLKGSLHPVYQGSYEY